LNLLIAGATGFIGTKLVAALQSKHTITALGRDKKKLRRQFDHSIHTLDWTSLPDLDARAYDCIIHLCGYNLAASRWNARVKEEIIQSRVATTSALVAWAIKHEAKPHFICANAVGIYGMQDNTDKATFDEDSVIDLENPRDFMGEIGIRWQQALEPAIDYGLNVTSARFGVVLGYGDGMLKKLLPSFYLGLGSIIGDGKQMISWIHIDDVVGAILFLVDKPHLTGAFNITAPNPVSQSEFARALAKTIHRPLFLKIPAVMIRLLFGEMGDCLLLHGQRVIPHRLLTLGYHFHYPHLIDALRDKGMRSIT
jgi:uncharacterized protein (TIGR01777 family)